MEFFASLHSLSSHLGTSPGDLLDIFGATISVVKHQQNLQHTNNTKAMVEIFDEFQRLIRPTQDAPGFLEPLNTSSAFYHLGPFSTTVPTEQKPPNPLVSTHSYSKEFSGYPFVPHSQQWHLVPPHHPDVWGGPHAPINRFPDLHGVVNTSISSPVHVLELADWHVSGQEPGSTCEVMQTFVFPQGSSTHDDVSSPFQRHGKAARHYASRDYASRDYASCDLNAEAYEQPSATTANDLYYTALIPGYASSNASSSSSPLTGNSEETTVPAIPFGPPRRKGRRSKKRGGNNSTTTMYPDTWVPLAVIKSRSSGVTVTCRLTAGAGNAGHGQVVGPSAKTPQPQQCGAQPTTPGRSVGGVQEAQGFTALGTAAATLIKALMKQTIIDT
ncbi:unnamed protein product [Cyclocybe aegerita]|uniref:Uncharacterized protein n=1 Tax=Cyclocybe aegerita TaxID=1973307 RepID=A0A8S0WZM0_CYCAE|nr:unnamed protein product [Cyclocybe aegerita]